jgi:radical SAM superfamily enzyme YgiQ (UPF0313 family)
MILLTTLNSKYIHTSLALYSLQAYCQREFAKIEVKEFNINQDLGFILGEIYKSQPQVLGISTNIWNITQSLEVMERVKKVMSETIVILGGPEASADYDSILRQAVAPDFIVRGEGEETLRELLGFIETGKPDLQTLPGLAFKNGDQICLTPLRPPLDLEKIPFPYPDPAVFRNRLVYYESSRGCPFHCAYCLSGWEEANLRYLPVERVKADLTRFIEAGVGTVKLIDRTFNLHRHRALEIMEFLAGQEGKTEFHLEMVGELIDEQIIHLLQTAPPGRFRVEIGVQSTCEKALAAVNRRYDLERLRHNCLAITHGRRTTVHLDLIAGLPYEDLETFSHSFDWTFRLHPDELQLGFLKLLKASPLRTKAREYGYLYTQTPPYELLQSKWLPFKDLLHLKAVEEMVEKFFNSKQFSSTLAYLFREETASPWHFFSTLAQFWEEHQLRGRAQKPATFFNGLWSYFQTTSCGANELEKLRDLLTFDFYLSGSGGKAPDWLTPQAPSLRERVKSILKEEGQAKLFLPAELKPADLRRRMIILALRIDPETGVERISPLLIYTPAQGRPSWFRLPVADLNLPNQKEKVAPPPTGGEDR